MIKKLLVVGLCFSVILFAGCGRGFVKNKICGTWEFDHHLSEEDGKENPLPDGATVDLILKGKIRFDKDGRYDESHKRTIKIKTPATGDFQLKFFSRTVGGWSLSASGKKLVCTVTDADFTPLDKVTADILSVWPEVSTIASMKGEVSTKKILSISDSTMKCKEPDGTLVFIYNKKH